MKVLIFGTFDHLHPGHHAFINQALERGELFIGVARDTNVQKIKGRAALQSEEERKRVIEEAFPTANVLLGHPSDFMALIRDAKPDLILLGYDQKLPPGLSEKDLGVTIERAKAFEPEKYKSSLRREKD
jgi:FAD synthetase